MRQIDKILLVDNGSIKADVHLGLRRIAARLSKNSGFEVEAVSLLHSNRINKSLLDGDAAAVFERTMEDFLEQGIRSFMILPYFIGPTGAITKYMPARLAALRSRFGPFSVRCAPFLFKGIEDDDTFLTKILCDNIESVFESVPGGVIPCGAIVDHGSPLPEVTAVRDYLSERLESVFKGRIDWLGASSMERRPEAEYDFNEPLLAHLLKRQELRNKTLVLSRLFLARGRHAGAGGDIDDLIQSHSADGLTVLDVPLVGDHPGIVNLLELRLIEGLKKGWDLFSRVPDAVLNGGV